MRPGAREARHLTRCAACREAAPVLGDLEVSAELVLVDDASTDGSFALLRQTRPTLVSLKALRLAENVGSQQALLCGMSVANGDAVVNMDADLQHPPEELPRMLAAWQSGYDIVEMYRTGAEALDPLRTLGTRLFYALHRLTSPTPAAPSSNPHMKRRGVSSRRLSRSAITRWRRKS